MASCYYCLVCTTIEHLINEALNSSIKENDKQIGAFSVSACDTLQQASEASAIRQQNICRYAMALSRRFNVSIYIYIYIIYICCAKLNMKEYSS